MSTEPGDSIGPYVISRELGRGGMGGALSASDRLFRCRIAVKAVLTDLPEACDRSVRCRPPVLPSTNLIPGKIGPIGRTVSTGRAVRRS